MTDAEYEQLVADSLTYMSRAIAECNSGWDFQAYRRWDLDLDRRVLTFSDGPKPPIDCDIQVVGTYMTNRGVWRWAWDNPSVEPALCADLDRVRAFGEEHGVEELAVGGWEAGDEEAAWHMTAVAARLTGAKSVYRAPDPPRHVFLLVMGVRWAEGGRG